MTAPAFRRAEDGEGTLGQYAYVSFLLDRFELDGLRPRSGAAAMPKAADAVTLGLHAYYSHNGTLAGDWPAIDFSAPPLGRVYVGLHLSGETFPLLQTRVTQGATEFDHFLLLDGRIHRCVGLRKIDSAPAWPWKVVPWTDRASASQLFDRAVSLWPRRHDGTFAPMLEPMKVTSVHGAGSGEFGIGLNPVFAGPEAGLPGYRLRQAADLPATLPARRVDKAAASRPPMLLWSSEGARADAAHALHLRRTEDRADPVWTPLGKDDGSYAGFRVCLPHPEGSHPDVLLRRDMSLADALRKAKSDDRALRYAAPPLSGMDLVSWCPRCMAEEEKRERAVAGGFCRDHFEQDTKLVKGLAGLTCPRSPYGTHRYSKARGGGEVPYCKYCNARKLESGMPPGPAKWLAALPAAGLDSD